MVTACFAEAVINLQLSLPGSKPTQLQCQARKSQAPETAFAVKCRTAPEEHAHAVAHSKSLLRQSQGRIC